MTWLDVPADHPFGIANLPSGVFSTPASGPRVGTRIGDHVLDLAPCAEKAGRESYAVWQEPSLNTFLALGRPAWTAAREWIVEVLTNPSRRDCVEPHLIALDEVTMHLPIEVADYVDFYASEHHATNVGRILRPDGEPLHPSWRHLPIGYHGRAGTVVVTPRSARFIPGRPAAAPTGPLARRSLVF